MSDAPFRSAAEEVAALTKELAEVRAALRDLNQRFSQIERHVKRAFQVKPEPPPGRRPRGETDGPRLDAQPRTRSAVELLEIYKHLVNDSAADPAVADERLGRMEIGDLRLMAHELGLPGGTKPGKGALIRAILGRVKESLLLSKNTNVTLPRSANAAQSADVDGHRPSEVRSSDQNDPAGGE